ncbi:MAG: exo-alpha-sialidase [Brevibacillus sp.]|nr:exo-alpha-sialidase [Brevibacillus sp.]
MATTVVNAAYDTSVNGGRKLVRLSNGWLVANTSNPSNGDVYYFVSKDDGGSWEQLCYATLSETTGHAIVSVGTTVYGLFSNAANVYSVKFDATTVTNNALTLNLIEIQNAINSCSLAIAPDGTLHAAWSSKNSSYPNSFNIRYSKSTDGGQTWATPTQVTASNNSGVDNRNPCVVIDFSGFPVIFYDLYNGSTYFIKARTTTDGTTFTARDVYYVGSYAQSSPCAIVDGNGVIHVVWHGKDSTDTTVHNIRYSKSTDGGKTWSAAVKLTSGNTYPQFFPSIAVDNSNKLYVLWHGKSAASPTCYQVRKIEFESVWSSITDLTSNTINDAIYPSVMEKEVGNIIGWIWLDEQTDSVMFDSVTFNNAPTLSLTSPTDNQVLSAGETLEVEGTASDPDGNSITVIASLNGTALGTVGTGTGTANWQVSIPEPDLQLGDNTLVVTAIDSQGASTSKTFKLTKTDGDVPILVNDVRYKLPATDDVVAWVKREGALTVDAALSGVAAGESEWFTPMEKTPTGADEDQFYLALPVKKDDITLRLTMTRQSVDQDAAITRLIGGIGK